jgi:hypothetical protein
MMEFDKEDSVAIENVQKLLNNNNLELNLTFNKANHGNLSKLHYYIGNIWIIVG